MKKRRKQRTMRGFAAFLLLVSVCAACFSGEGFRADASGVHTIPGTGYLNSIKAARSLNISRSTLSSYTYNNGISGKRVNYTDNGGAPTTQFTVPLSDESKAYTYSNPLTLNFSNVGTINGRQLDATVSVTSVKISKPSENHSDSGLNGGQVGILKLKDGWFEVGVTTDSPHGYRARKQINLNITIRYGDGSREVVPLPFYQAVLDIDAGGYGKQDYYREAWTGVSGYTGDIYAFPGHTTSISGMTITARGDEGAGTDGDDIYLKTGAFAPTTGGSFSMMFDVGNCGTGLDLFSAYQNLIAPEKSVSKPSDGTSFQAGDEIVWNVSQRMPVFYGNTFTKFGSMVFEDTLPEGVTYKEAKLYDGNTEVTGSYGSLSYNSSARKVTYTMNSAFLGNAGYYNGRTLRLEVKTSADKPDVPLKTVKNRGYVRMDGLARQTNEVQAVIAQPSLQIIKTTPKESYNNTEPVPYSIEVSQTVSGAVARNVLITDREIPDGVEIDMSDIVLSGVTGTVEKYDNYFQVKIPRLAFGQKAKVDFRALVNPDTFDREDAPNTAKASCDNCGEKQSTANPKIYYYVHTKIDHGTITGSRDNLTNGSDFTVSYQPEKGYYISKVTVDGREKELKFCPDAWEFTDIDKNHEVVVTTRKIPRLKITKDADKEEYNYQETVEYMITVEQTIPGAVADRVFVTDRDMTEGLELDLDSIEVDREDALVETSRDYLEVSIPHLEYGKPLVITVKGKVNNDTLKLKELINWAAATCDNGEKAENDEPISVYYRIDTHAVNGTITRSDSRIAHGENRYIEYRPDKGYYLKSLTVDGNTLDAETYPHGLTFEDISQNYEVEAVFAKIPDLELVKKAEKKVYKPGEQVRYTIRLSESVEDGVAEDVVLKDTDLPEGLRVLPGTIEISEPLASLESADGGFVVRIPELAWKNPVTVTFYAAIEPGQLKSSSLKNHAEASCRNNPKAKAQDTAAPEVKNNIVTSAENGRITPDETGIGIGETRKIYYAPDKGYYLKKLSVDDHSVSAADYPDSYPFADIRRSHKIHAVFAKTPALKVTKGSDREVYGQGEYINYTVCVENTMKDSIAENLTVADTEMSPGAEIDSGSITCDREFTLEHGESGGFCLRLKEGLASGETVTVGYRAKIRETGKVNDRIVNTAKAVADGMKKPEQDRHSVRVDQPEYLTGQNPGDAADEDGTAIADTPERAEKEDLRAGKDSGLSVNVRLTRKPEKVKTGDDAAMYILAGAGIILAWAGIFAWRRRKNR